MRPMRVTDIERESYPVNQVHVPADGIDIAQGSGLYGEHHGQYEPKTPREVRQVL